MTKKSKISLIVVAIILTSVLAIMMSDTEMKQEQSAVPWLIDTQKSDQTKVVSLNIGKGTLSEMVHTLRKLPELAVFETPDGKRTVEAFFSRVKQGVLIANIVAEVDAEGKDLSLLARVDEKGDPMPSGQWRWNLSKTGIITVNKWRVWKLAYIPTTKYSAQQILKFFGQPDSKKKMGDVSLLTYEEKALVITEDSEGRAIFYYSSKDDYVRLVDSLFVISTPIK
ncbi:MAG TPA: hypothetical protein EYH35_01630 [Thiotrichaceae bacterium]|nr:hypothetical protein [Thiotrichaceae bacterium]